MSSQGVTTSTAEHGTRRPISTLTVLERDGSTQRLLRVLCPMDRRTVSVERCIECPMCARLDASDVTLARPSVVCAFPVSALSAVVAGSALSRYGACVRADAVGTDLPTTPSASMPIVDAEGRLVGMATQDSAVRMDQGALSAAVDERTPVSGALAHMARRRLRQVPVVDRDGIVVGVLDDLEAMRSLRSPAPDQR